ncbi:hypothetical protein V6N00_12575 [Tersicoccus sp. MR15.9]|uniref:hypothetical protein n=1 Tax=Tersicoccus mangrovi TaxID=3121635 RepID=UPI002FE66034
MSRSPMIMLTALVMAVVLGGCAVPSSSPDDSQSAEGDAAAVREVVTGLDELNGPMTIESFSDRTCVNPDQPNPQTRSSWLAGLRFNTKKGAETDALIGRIDSWAKSHGFDKRKDVAGTEREVGWAKTDLSIQAVGQMNGGMEVVVRAPCRDHPESYKLYRDKLDPQYGTGGSYEDGKGSSSPSP